MAKIFSDLNLNGDVPVRVQPELGVWGPTRVPSVAARQRTRRKVIAAAISITLLVGYLFYFFYQALQGISG